eukprot:1161099-Pelagomonas_calceolata.AAC.1
MILCPSIHHSRPFAHAFIPTLVFLPPRPGLAPSTWASESPRAPVATLRGAMMPSLVPLEPPPPLGLDLLLRPDSSQHLLPPVLCPNPSIRGALPGMTGVSAAMDAAAAAADRAAASMGALPGMGGVSTAMDAAANRAVAAAAMAGFTGGAGEGSGSGLGAEGVRQGLVSPGSPVGGHVGAQAVIPGRCWTMEGLVRAQLQSSSAAVTISCGCLHLWLSSVAVMKEWMYKGVFKGLWLAGQPGRCGLSLPGEAVGAGESTRAAASRAEA